MERLDHEEKLTINLCGATKKIASKGEHSDTGISESCSKIDHHNPISSTRGLVRLSDICPRPLQMRHSTIGSMKNNVVPMMTDGDGCLKVGDIISIPQYLLFEIGDDKRITLFNCTFSPRAEEFSRLLVHQAILPAFAGYLKNPVSHHKVHTAPYQQN